MVTVNFYFYCCRLNKEYGMYIVKTSQLIISSSLFSKKLKHQNIINVLAPEELLQTYYPDQCG